MIKTNVNRHDLEYFIFAMVKAFYKDAEVLAPDTAEHNKSRDDVGENEDVIDVVVNSDSLVISFYKGKLFPSDKEYKYNLNDAEDKDEIRGYIYDSLVDYFGRSLPWGNLTGIRPTKLYLNEIRRVDGNIDTAMNNLNSVFRVSEKKGKLAADIAVREDRIIKSIDNNDFYSVYIGIPFCPSRCLYCSFTSNLKSTYNDRIMDYLDCIKKELLATVDIMKGKKIDTIYIGGGTPTSLTAKELDILLSYVSDVFNLSDLSNRNIREFTLEAGRPDTITAEQLKVIGNYPVSRISINPQTFSDRTLKLIGRTHTGKDVEEIYYKAREMGYDNINMDIILGLPGETIDDVRYSMDKICGLLPDNLTVHSLAVKRASRLKEWLDSQKDSDFYRKQMDMEAAMNIVLEKAEISGFKPYYLYRQKDMGGNLENTGMARNEKYGFYNILMMEEVQTIVACGAGTVTKRVYPDGRIERCDTVKDVNLYISKIEEMIDRKRVLFKD